MRLEPVMRDQKLFATPLVLGLGALAFFLTVGAGLYLKGSPVDDSSNSDASANAESANTTSSSNSLSQSDAPMSTSEQPIRIAELDVPERPSYSVAGTVRSDNGTLIPEADVRLFLVQGDQEREVTRLLTDESGRFESVLSSLASLSTESLLASTMEARIVAPGHLPERRRINATEGSPLTATEVTLTSGHHLRGRILTDEGEPVVGCSVDLYLNCPPGTPRRDTKRHAVTDQHGEYVFGWKRGQGLRFIDAEHSTWGKATIALDSVSAIRDQVLEDIRLDPGGTLEGVVTCKMGGDLLPGVRIDAHPKSNVRRGKRRWTFTGPDGSFHLSGLVPGQYDLWVEDSSRPVGTWKTGSDDIQLEVDLVRLVVSVRDPRDNPIPGQKIQFVNIAGSAASTLMSASSETAKGSEALAVFSPARMTDFGETENGQSIAVAMRATSITVPTYEELIDIPEDACRIDHTFTLLSSEDLGRLRIRVDDPQGGQLEEPVISLISVHSGKRVTNLFDRDESPTSWSSTLAPGAYELRVEPRDRSSDENFLLDVVPAEPVEVKMGRETTVNLTARLGGRIRLQVNTIEPEGLEPSQYPERDVHVTIAPSDSEVLLHEAPSFAVQVGGEISNSMSARTQALGSEVLEAGEYSLRITCPGFETQEIQIEVTAGEIVDRRIELRPW